jgi:hypothetical protein
MQLASPAKHAHNPIKQESHILALHVSGHLPALHVSGHLPALHVSGHLPAL